MLTKYNPKYLNAIYLLKNSTYSQASYFKDSVFDTSSISGRKVLS